MKELLHKFLHLYQKYQKKSQNKTVPLPSAGRTSQVHDEENWLDVYEARIYFYESFVGQFPKQLIKIVNLNSVWPGGGLCHMPAEKLGSGLWAHSTFGLSNPDMPSQISAIKQYTEADGQDQATTIRSLLQAKPKSTSSLKVAGYGYELMAITKGNVEWPLHITKWAANAEIMRGINILGRVETFGGLTVQEISIHDNTKTNLLIAKSCEPFPHEFTLPNGKMELLVATVITWDEMEWALKNGNGALLRKLIDSDVGQISYAHRESILTHANT